MIQLDFPQGSPEWVAARLGIPTASRFDEILTPKKMTLSASADKYRQELLAEWLLGEPMDATSFDFTDRGTALEEEARSWYEMQTDSEVEQVGFLLRDDRKCGGSPDGLVGMDGGLELKCPAAHTHVRYLMEGGVDAAYKCQVQGNLWIAERDWWDVVSYHPSLPKVTIRVHREDIFIKALSTVVLQFCEYLEEGKLALQRKGVHPLTGPVEIPQWSA